jgi:hypothetical protein
MNELIKELQKVLWSVMAVIIVLREVMKDGILV